MKLEKMKLLDMSNNRKMKEKKRKKKLIKDPFVTLLYNMENMWSILNF